MRFEVLLKPSVLATLFFICVASIIGIKKVIKRSHKPPVPYTIAKPTRHNIVQYITASGTVKAKAKDQLTIGSLAAGKVEKLLADDNDIVKKDQILAILDNGIGKNGVDLAQAQLDQAQAQLTYEEKFLQRQTELYQSGELSQNAYDQVVFQHGQIAAKVAELKANFEIEKRKYEELFIRSPEDGTVTARKVDLGQMITSQLDAKVLFEVVRDLTELEVWADVDEADVGLVKDGQYAQFTVDTYPNRLFTSKVKLIQYNARTIDNSITYAAVLTVANHKLELRPGMTANVDIKVAECNKVICVPYSAQRINAVSLGEYAKKNQMHYQKLPVSDQPGKRTESLWVFEHGGFTQIPVVFGARDSSRVQVLEGLHESQEVVMRFLSITDNSAMLKSIFGGGSIGSSK